MNIIRSSFWILLAAFVWTTGCAKQALDPLAGFHWCSLVSLHSNKAITDDYQDYIQKLPAEKRKYNGDVSFSEDGTGQHAVSIEVFEKRNASWRHALIYDKENKRVKVIKYGYRKYES